MVEYIDIVVADICERNLDYKLLYKSNSEIVLQNMKSKIVVSLQFSFKENQDIRISKYHEDFPDDKETEIFNWQDAGNVKWLYSAILEPYIGENIYV